MTIGEKIYEMRTSRNMSLREFAKATGVTHTTIARLESPSMGTQKIFLDTVYQICKKLKYNFGQFLAETGYLPEYNSDNEVCRYSAEEKHLIENYREINSRCKKIVRDTVEIFHTAENKNRNGI